MANREKHPKNPLLEALDDDLVEVPTRARSPKIVGHYIKDRRTIADHPAIPPVPYKLEPAEMLRVGTTPQPEEPAVRSPLSSFEHLKKKQRLRQLRARNGIRLR